MSTVQIEDAGMEAGTERPLSRHKGSHHPTDDGCVHAPMQDIQGAPSLSTLHQLLLSHRGAVLDPKHISASLQKAADLAGSHPNPEAQLLVKTLERVAQTEAASSADHEGGSTGLSTPKQATPNADSPSPQALGDLRALSSLHVPHKSWLLQRTLLQLGGCTFWEIETAPPDALLASLQVDANQFLKGKSAVVKKGVRGTEHI